MLRKLLTRRNLNFERTYAAPADEVWQAWTQPDALRQWWGPEHTTVPECEVDLQIGGRIYIVMEATAGMGKYEGTRWPMAGEFTIIEPCTELAYDASSWTEGDENSTIQHTNSVHLVDHGETTTVKLRVSIAEVGSAAKMAAFGMKWGYKAQLDKLDHYLDGTP